MPTESKPPRDIVTEASMDSFPASDPPGWIRSHAATCETDLEVYEPYDISDMPSELRPSATSGPHLRRLKRIAIAAGITAGALVLYILRSRR